MVFLFVNKYLLLSRVHSLKMNPPCPFSSGLRNHRFTYAIACILVAFCKATRPSHTLVELDTQRGRRSTIGGRGGMNRSDRPTLVFLYRLRIIAFAHEDVHVFVCRMVVLEHDNTNMV
jgi:hypothetical protein